MAVSIYRTNHLGLKNMLVSDKLTIGEIAADLNVIFTGHLNGVNPVIIKPENKLPILLLTTEEFLKLKNANVPEINEAQMLVLVEAWQAAQI